MKAFIQCSFLFVLAAILFSCADAPEGEKAEIKEVEETPAYAQPQEGSVTYPVNPKSSIVRWTASKPGRQHRGVLRILDGELTAEEGVLTGGKITLDMTSITSLDLEGDERAKLEGDLKTGDFFETEKYPTGEFVITHVEPDTGGVEHNYRISGNLTLKDIVKGVTFPSYVNVKPRLMTAMTPKFTIDRTQWGINFKSTTIGSIADNAIHDEVGLLISLIALTEMPTQEGTE